MEDYKIMDKVEIELAAEIQDLTVTGSGDHETFDIKTFGTEAYVSVPHYREGLLYAASWWQRPWLRCRFAWQDLRWMMRWPR